MSDPTGTDPTATGGATPDGKGMTTPVKGGGAADTTPTPTPTTPTAEPDGKGMT